MISGSLFSWRLLNSMDFYSPNSGVKIHVWLWFCCCCCCMIHFTSTAFDIPFVSFSKNIIYIRPDLIPLLLFNKVTGYISPCPCHLWARLNDTGTYWVATSSSIFLTSLSIPHPSCWASEHPFQVTYPFSRCGREGIHAVQNPTPLLPSGKHVIPISLSLLSTFLFLFR